MIKVEDFTEGPLGLVTMNEAAVQEYFLDKRLNEIEKTGKIISVMFISSDRYSSGRYDNYKIVYREANKRTKRR